MPWSSGWPLPGLNIVFAFFQEKLLAFLCVFFLFYLGVRWRHRIFFFSHLSPILYWCFICIGGFDNTACFFLPPPPLWLDKEKKGPCLIPFVYVHLLISVATVYHIIYVVTIQTARRSAMAGGPGGGGWYCATFGREYNYFVK